MQRTAVIEGRRAIERAFEFPLEQTVELQRDAAEMVLHGLDLQEEFGRRNVDLYRAAFESYLDAVEATLPAATPFEGDDRSTEERSERGREPRQRRGRRRQTAGGPGRRRGREPPRGEETEGRERSRSRRGRRGRERPPGPEGRERRREPPAFEEPGSEMEAR